ncbi:MAG: ankyrin repeat domain-containing protein, partial [Ignavibacteriales bacterium]
MLSPSEIMMKRFSYKALGYDSDELDSFKARLAEELDSLLSENAKLQQVLNKVGVDLAWRQDEDGVSTRVLDMVKGKTEAFQEDLREEARQLGQLVGDQAISSLRLHQDIVDRTNSLLNLLKEITDDDLEFIDQHTEQKSITGSVSGQDELTGSMDMLKNAYYRALNDLELLEKDLFGEMSLETAYKITGSTDATTFNSSIGAARSTTGLEKIVSESDLVSEADHPSSFETHMRTESDIVSGSKQKIATKMEVQTKRTADLLDDEEPENESEKQAYDVFDFAAIQDRLRMESAGPRITRKEPTYEEMPPYWQKLNKAPRRRVWIISLIAALILGVFLYMDPSVKSAAENLKQALTGSQPPTSNNEPSREEQGRLLMAAAKKGDTEQIKQLIKGKADINYRNDKGETALMWTARNGDLMNTMVLIKMGANLNLGNKNGDNALLWALSYKKPNVVKILLAEGADVNVRDLKAGLTPLMYVALEGDMET